MFKFGITFVVLVAIYLYYVINYVGEDDKREQRSRSVVVVDKDGVSVSQNLEEERGIETQYADKGVSSDSG